MTSLTLATVIQASIMAAAPETYADAQRVTAETGKPMVVMVSTDWCRPCQTMKKTVIPQVRKHGLLRKVAFAIVNPDRDRELARKLIGKGPIPQLLMFRKTPKGWRRKKLVGGQSVRTVEKFIEEGIAQDAKTKRDTREEKRGASPKTDDTAAGRVSGNDKVTVQPVSSN